MTKCCGYYGVNESVHFNNVWEMSVQISLEANDLDLSTVLGLSTKILEVKKEQNRTELLTITIHVYTIASIVQGSIFQ
jgi:hypothetical protein